MADLLFPERLNRYKFFCLQEEFIHQVKQRKVGQYQYCIKTGSKKNSEEKPAENNATPKAAIVGFATNTD